MGTRFDRRIVLTALAASVLSGCGGADGPTAEVAPPAPQPPTAAPPPPPVLGAGVAVKWSDLATNAMLADSAAQPPGLSPMEQSRILAMAFLAGHDALNSIRRMYQRYRVQTDQYAGLDFASAPYAYEAALCGVLRTLLPGHAAEFDRALQESLAAGAVLPNSDAVQLGGLCAQTLLVDRASDGSANAQGPYVPGSEPGDYQPTPPVNAATFVNWGKVRPFVMTTGDQFRAPPPLDVGSAAYAADFNEVKSLGAAVGSTRTAEQSEIATFWLESTPLSWQRIAVIQWGAHLPLWSCARFFALLQMSQADAYIASLESKYHHNFWRPITAIRAADTDGNSDTLADSAWMPLDPVTPPVPEYPSAHACAATAGAGVFNSLDRTLEGTTSYRSSTGAAPRNYDFDYLDYAYGGGPPPAADQIAAEIGLSRIYVGYHFRHAVEAGWDQGRAVARWVHSNALQAI